MVQQHLNVSSPSARYGQAIRRLGAAVGAVAACLMTGRWAVAAGQDLVDAYRDPSMAGVDGLLIAVVSTAAAVIAVWFSACVALAVFAAVPGQVGGLMDRWSRPFVPRAIRRLVAIALGTALVGAGTSGCAAPPVSVPRPSVVASVGQSALSEASVSAPSPGFVAAAPSPLLVPTPRRSATPVPPAPRPAGNPPGQPRSQVIVHRGDTLWTIAARALGGRATREQIAAEWPRWYAANRSVIGPDPDLITVGMVLRDPGRSR